MTYRKGLAIGIGLLLVATCQANAQDDPQPPPWELIVPGGTILWSMEVVPDTVFITDTVTLPPIVLPPDTVYVERCPDGWTCTPPPEPEADFVIATPTGDYANGDTIPDGAYERFFEDAAGEWRALGLGYNAGRVPGIDSVVFFDGERRRNRESLYPYGVWNERGNWNAAPGEPYTIIALMYQSDGTVITDTVAVLANPNTPPVPPDTVPPTPPDTVPPGPGDSIPQPEPGDTIALSTPTNLRVVDHESYTGYRNLAWEPIPEAKQGTNGTGYPANDPDVRGDEVYYRVSNIEVWPDTARLYADGSYTSGLRLDTVSALASVRRSFAVTFAADPVAFDSIRFCVTAEAWDCPSCVGPGGQRFFPYRDETGGLFVPVSKTTCSDVLEVQ